MQYVLCAGADYVRGLGSTKRRFQESLWGIAGLHRERHTYTMTNVGRKTGIIYCRVSSKEQVERTSLDTQEKMCREYAERNEIDVLATFIERGESAKTADRTEFKKAIAFCADKKRPVGYFIVYKIDRFARNQNDHTSVRALLKRNGTELRSVTEPISEDSVGRLMEGVLSSFAEFDNNVRTERTRGGMEARIKQGIWQWRAPLGYYRSTKSSNIVPEPTTAPYIRLCFEEYAKRTYSYDSLAQFLAERGLRTRTGKKPFKQLVEKIIKNPIYCGVMDVWGEQHKGTFEPIISEELFFQCQERYKGKARFTHRITANPDFPLRNHAACDACNTSLTGSFSTGRKGKKYGYYHHHKQGCPRATFIPKATLEQLFVEYLAEITPGVRYEKSFKAVVLDIWKTNYQKHDEVNQRIRKQLEQLEAERQKVFDLRRSDVYTDEEFLEQKNLINERISEKHRLISENRVEEFNMEQALDHCFRFVRSTAKTWLRLGIQSFPLQQRFQKNVFPGKIGFAGEKFGTAKLSLVYSLNQEYGGKKSHLVAPTGFEPVF